MHTQTKQAAELERTIQQLEVKPESFLEKEVKGLEALKGFEILRIDEVWREFGHYLFVFFKGVKVDKCGCKPNPFVSTLHAYQFCYVYLVGDMLKPWGQSCIHFNGKPSDSLLETYIRRAMAVDPEHKNSEYLDDCEARLERRYNKVFGIKKAS